VPEFNTAALFFRRLRIGGVAVGAYTPAEAQAAWGRVLGLLGKTGARPLIDSVWEFERLKEAFGRLAEGPMGKVVLRVP
jgi:NADPH2:quinone reductase